MKGARLQSRDVVLIDFSIFKNKPYSGATLSNFLLNAIAGTLVVANTYVQLGRGFNAFQSGMLSLGYLVAVLAMIRVGEKILQRAGAKSPMIWGAFITTIGVAMMGLTFLSDLAYTVAVFVGFALFGLGLGIYATPSTDTSVANAPANKVGEAAGIYKMASSLGGAFGVAISATVFGSISQAGSLEFAASAGIIVNVIFGLLSILSIVSLVPGNAGKRGGDQSRDNRFELPKRRRQPEPSREGVEDSSMVYDKIVRRLDEKRERMIEIRRYLHEHPELSFQEEQTAQYIADFYQGVPVDRVETNFGGQRGIVVTINGLKPGKTIAIRADFDALPIHEQTGLPFASKNEGVMHACGHDGHTAYMLVLAETLAELKDQLKGTIRVIHQPGEETPPGGALGMIEAGVLDGVDVILGIHVMSNMKTGHIYYRSGNTQTGRSYFKLVVQGKGGHGSSPHLANDAIVAASAFVMNIQTIVSRRINPFDTASITIGNLDGKGSFNVIKDAVTIEGDVRTMSPETQTIVETGVRAFAEGLEASYGVQAALAYHNDYPVLYNDPEVTEHVRQAIEAASIPEVEKVLETPPQPPSEDFAYYLQRVPGCFFYVGAAPEGEEAYPHHHPKFNIDERSLIISAKAMAAVLASCCDGSLE